MELFFLAKLTSFANFLHNSDKLEGSTNIQLLTFAGLRQLQTNTANYSFLKRKRQTRSNLFLQS